MAFPNLIRLVAVAFALTVTLARAGDLVEYYHAGLDHYFITGDANEIRALDSGVHRGWSRTSHTLQVFDPGDARLSNSIPVCRFYGSPAHGLDSHFYSATPQECAEVKVRFPEAWLLESEDVFRVHGLSTATGACPANTKAVYRLYNNRADANHRYTTDPGVADAMLAEGYILEGTGSGPRPVVFCSADIVPALPAADAPRCTLSASTMFPVLGVPLDMTASCTGSPTTFAWINCSSYGPSCTATASAAGPVAYGIVATNASGPGAPSIVTMNWLAAPPPPPPAGEVPTCNVVASSSAPAINSTLTLNASCTNGPTAYVWTNCASTTPTCTTTESTAGARTYYVNARNASGIGPAASVIVTWQQPPTAPPVCTLSANPANPYAGGSTMLTASCTQSPTSYIWVGCTASTGSSCQAMRTQVGQETYSVTAANAAGSSAPVSITLNWQAPPPGGADLCGNDPKVRRIDLVWGGSAKSNDPGGGFRGDSMFAGRIQVPSNATGTSVPGLISVVEFVDGPADRIMTLSPSACDFRGFQPGVFPAPDPTGANGPMAWGYGNSPSTMIELAGMPGRHPKLVPGQTYYVNVRNVVPSSGQPSCPSEECNVRVGVNPPQ